MATSFYESNRALVEYLLFHYGTAEQILPYSFGPHGALHFAERCVNECLNPATLPDEARALDLGCAVGRSSFELARHCTQVIGIDVSQSFITVAAYLRQQGSFTYGYVEEGDLTTPATAVVPADIPRERVSFEKGDAQELRSDLGQFHIVLLANLIDRLPDPRRCLAQLAGLVYRNGQLIVTSPYTWLEDHTLKPNWLGGFEKEGRAIRTMATLQEILSPDFELTAIKDLPFLIREHARKYQWSVAQASLWTRK